MLNRNRTTEYYFTCTNCVNVVVFNCSIKHRKQELPSIYLGGDFCVSVF